MIASQLSLSKARAFKTGAVSRNVSARLERVLLLVHSETPQPLVCDPNSVTSCRFRGPGVA